MGHNSSFSGAGNVDFFSVDMEISHQHQSHLRSHVMLKVMGNNQYTNMNITYFLQSLSF